MGSLPLDLKPACCQRMLENNFSKARMQYDRQILIKTLTEHETDAEVLSRIETRKNIAKNQM